MEMKGSLGRFSQPKNPEIFRSKVAKELDDEEIEAYSDLDEAERLIETQHGDGTDCDIDMSNLTHPFSRSI